MSYSEDAKREKEERILSYFLESYPRITERSLSILKKSESPDFMALSDEQAIGIELAAIYFEKNLYLEDPSGADCVEKCLDEAWRLAEGKDESYNKNNRYTLPIILILYLNDPSSPYTKTQGEPLYYLEDTFSDSYLDDFENLGFEEIWLMDISSEFHCQGNPFKSADLFCIKPEGWRGFYEVAERSRTPFK